MILDRVLTALLYVLPQHLLAAGMYRIARCPARWLKDALIRFVVRRYRVDLAEAAEPDPAAYPTFNAFFTRALRPDARPLADSAVLCPADGRVSQAGTIVDGRIVQAKGQDYSVLELLAGDRALAGRFAGGSFATVYLSPRDYHRVHMPVAGELQAMTFVPGSLFSVSDNTTRIVPRLFARNERLVSLFESDLGPVAVILVGAIFVGSMETVWAGEIRGTADQPTRRVYAPADRVRLERGAEMGRFNMGSTVILLFGRDRVAWHDDLLPGSAVRMGEAIGSGLTP